jgi:hypothetical protein
MEKYIFTIDKEITFVGCGVVPYDPNDKSTGYINGVMCDMCNGTGKENGVLDRGAIPLEYSCHKCGGVGVGKIWKK